MTTTRQKAGRKTATKATVKKAAPKKPAVKKPAAKQAVVKKAAAKKPVSKKVATRKAVTKKPTAKKAAVKKSVAKTSSTKPSRGPVAPVAMDTVLGQIVRVLSVSPEHSTMALGDLLTRVAPAMRLGQCRVLVGDDGHPFAYAAWARVSAAVHKRLEGGERTLKPEEWNSGGNPWLIDLAAPPKAIPTVLAQLQASVFKGERVRTMVKRENE